MTKQNLKLEHKYLGPFEIVEALGNQVYRLNFPVKWRIHLVFHVLFLERNITRREAVDQKIADQLKFEKREQPEHKIDSIADNMVFAEEAIDGKPPWLYYLIQWKGKTHTEDIWKPVEGVTHLQQLLKSYHAKNPDKPTNTSSPIDKDTLSPPMAA